MKPVRKEYRDLLRGYLPFYSVDTRAEADALIQAALAAGEFYQPDPDGPIIEVTLAADQTLENLETAGKNLAALHEGMR